MLRTATLATSLMLIGALLLTGPSPFMGPALAQNEESADLTRSFDPAPTWECGGGIMVLIDIDWDPEPAGSNTGLSVEESYPSSWTVTATTNGGSTGTPGQVKWFIFDPSVEQLSYSLSIPSDAEGDFDFHGEYRDPSLGQGDGNKVVQGADSASVTCTDSPPGNGDGNGDGPGTGAGSRVDRVFDADGDWNQGDGDRRVTLELTWGDLVGSNPPQFFIEESVEQGMAVEFPSDGGQISDGGQTIKWWINDKNVASVHYWIVVDEDHPLGTFDFHGEWRNNTMGPGDPNQDITGQQTATVSETEDPPADAAEVERGLPLQTQCTQEIVVSLSITRNDATQLTITETVPADWTIAEPGAGVEGPEGTLTWQLDSDDLPWGDITYSVNVPVNTEGQFLFTGSFTDDTGADEMTGGDDQLQVTCPDTGMTTRTLPPVCSGTFRVHLMVEPNMADAWFVDETPPEGLVFEGASEGGTFDPGSGQIKWVDTSGASAELWYDLSVPQDAPEGETHQWFGEFRFDPEMDQRETIGGDDSVTTDCGFVHPYDLDQDCVFSDDDLFTLIDAWKDEEEEATDDVLFAGIAHWKRAPEPYCEETA